MEQVSRIGMDTSKHIFQLHFQLHSVDAAEWTCVGEVESSLLKEEDSHAQIAQTLHTRVPG